MTLDQIIAIADVAAVVLSAAAFAFGFYVHAVAGGKIASCRDELKKEFDAETKAVAAALYARINGFGDRLQIVETKVDDTARRDDLHKLSLQLVGMSGDLKAMAVKMESLNESARITGIAIKRVENHLFHIEGA
ncbi:MAG: DUF2730 family protein [Rhizomicrobium sp.]